MGDWSSDMLLARESFPNCPRAVFQSGGFPRELCLGQLLRDDQAEVARWRRSLSQSVLWQSGELPLLPDRSKEQLAALESLAQILNRGELCPTHPAVEKAILTKFFPPLRKELKARDEALGKIRSLGEIPNNAVMSLLSELHQSRRVLTAAPPIEVFDDESGGARRERPRWEKLVAFADGTLAPWVHCQVLLQTLSPKFADDHRRADFVIAPPWCDPLVWEVHGEFDSVDQEKDKDIQKVGFQTFNEVVGETTEDECESALSKLLAKDDLTASSDAFRNLLDAFWVASQVDLGLFHLIASGQLGKPGMVVRLKIPKVFRKLAAAAVEEFRRLVQGCELVWGLDGGERLIQDGVEILLEEGAGLSVEIDPSAVAYPPAHEKLSADVSIRRIALPGDVRDCWRNWSRRELHGLRPAQDPEEVALCPALERCFGFSELRPGQLRAVAAAMRGEDAIVLLPTGHGKSLVFQLAGLFLPGATLVVAPLKALMDDQVRNLQDRGFSRVLSIHSDRPLDQDTGTADLLSSIITYVAPERFYVEEFEPKLEALLESCGVDILVVDEAHTVSQAGHSFRPSYLGLADRMAEFARRSGQSPPPRLALTATAAEIVVRDIRGILKISSEPISLDDEMGSGGFARRNLKDEIVVLSPAGGHEAVEDALAARVSGLAAKGRGIVFCQSKKHWTKSAPRWYGVNGTKNRLRGMELDCATYVGGENMSAADRQKQTTRFVSGDCATMVATDAFGAGIDLPDIRWIFQIGMPAGIECYVQQLGRAGRDGRAAKGVLIADLDADEIIQALITARQEKDSFGRLQEVLGAGRRDKLGSIARQLWLMVGNKSFENVPDFRPRIASIEYVPSFPGWEFEAKSFDWNLIGTIFEAGDDRELEWLVHSRYDGLGWKAVNRAVELGLIHASYRRSSAKSGTIKFVVRSTQLSSATDPDKLGACIQEYVARLRGHRMGVEIGKKSRDLLADEKLSARDRAFRAAKTLVANTYEAVRDSRLGSLDGLLTYCRTGSQAERHQQIEDYFSRDDFAKSMARFCGIAPSVADWEDAIWEAESEERWRLFVFQRLAEDNPGMAFPNFMLLVGVLREGRGDEALLPFSSVFINTEDVGRSELPEDVLRWAWDFFIDHTDRDLARAFKDVVNGILMRDKAAGRLPLAELVLDWSNEQMGTDEMVHSAIAVWVEHSLGE